MLTLFPLVLKKVMFALNKPLYTFVPMHSRHMDDGNIWSNHKKVPYILLVLPLISKNTYQPVAKSWSTVHLQHLCQQWKKSIIYLIAVKQQGSPREDSFSYFSLFVQFFNNVATVKNSLHFNIRHYYQFRYCISQDKGTLFSKGQLGQLGLLFCRFEWPPQRANKLANERTKLLAKAGSQIRSAKLTNPRQGSP